MYCKHIRQSQDWPTENSVQKNTSHWMDTLLHKDEGGGLRIQNIYIYISFIECNHTLVV